MSIGHVAARTAASVNTDTSSVALVSVPVDLRNLGHGESLGIVEDVSEADEAGAERPQPVLQIRGLAARSSI